MAYVNPRVEQYQYLYERPSAQAYGTGQCLVAGKEYTSDGEVWSGPDTDGDLIRDTPVRVATYGSSLAACGSWTSPDNINTELCDCAFPGTGVNTQLYNHLDRFALKTVYPQAFLVRNCGIGGETSTQMIARDVAVASITRASILDIMDASVDVVIMRGINVNTIAGANLTSLPSKIIEEYDNHVTILNRMLSLGCHIIDELDYGYYSTPPTSVLEGEKQKALVAITDKVKGYIDQLKNPKLVYINPVGLTCNSSFGFLDGISIDKVHLSYTGSKKVAEAEAVILTKWFGASSKIRYPGTNLCSNPLMLTTTAQSYGTLATGHVVSVNTNATHQNAKVEVINGSTWQTCEYVPTGAGAFTANLYLPFSLASLSITSGDKFGIEFDYFIEGLTSSIVAPVTFLDARATFPKTGNGQIICYGSKLTVVSSTYGAINGGYEGRIVFNPIKINEDAAALGTPLLQLTLQFSSTNSVAANALKIGVGCLRVVKLA